MPSQALQKLGIKGKGDSYDGKLRKSSGDQIIPPDTKRSQLYLNIFWIGSTVTKKVMSADTVGNMVIPKPAYIYENYLRNWYIPFFS